MLLTLHWLLSYRLTTGSIRYESCSTFYYQSLSPGLSSRIVLDLLAGFEHSGVSVYMDKFYTIRFNPEELNIVNINED